MLVDRMIVAANTVDWATSLTVGAAVVQAIGALLAIIWTSKLARNSEQHASLAEKRAEQRAEELEQRRLDFEFERPVRISLGLARPVLLHMQKRQQIWSERVAHGDQGLRPDGTFGGVELLVREIPFLQREATTGFSKSAIGWLGDAVEPIRDQTMAGPSEWAQRYRVAIGIMEDAISELCKIKREEEMIPQPEPAEA